MDLNLAANSAEESFLVRGWDDLDFEGLSAPRGGFYLVLWGASPFRDDGAAPFKGPRVAHASICLEFIYIRPYVALN